MTVLEGLSKEQDAQITEAIDKITIEMLEGLDFGEDIALTDHVTLSHYCDDEIIVVNLTEEWIEVLQVMWDTENRKGIVYEAL
jgi:hypothetical protein